MASPGVRLDYHRQRQLRCRRAVLAWLRRWGAYLGMAGVLLAAGSNSPGAVLAGALGALVLPLLHGVQAWSTGAGWTPLLLGLLGYTTALALPAALTRPLWWPAPWAQAECALPLSAADWRASDRRLLAWVMLPLPLLVACGAVLLGLAHPPLWAEGLAAALGLLVLCTAAAAWAVDRAIGHLRARRRGLAGMRQPPAHRRAGDGKPTGHRPGSPAQAKLQAVPVLKAVPAWRALLCWPLLRGKARRTAQGLLLGGLASPALAAGPLATGAADAGLWMAALAALALGSASWLRSHSREELAGLWRALPALPLPAARLNRQRRTLCLLPMGAGLLVASPVLLHLGARPGLLLAWGATLALACWREAHPPPPAADQHAVRWLFSLVLTVVLGTELMP